MPDPSDASDSSDSEAAQDPWIGQTLASYEIIRRIGEGGMGIVYLGRHKSLDRLAAIKFLPSTMVNDAAYIEMFLHEAKAAAKLNHPNVITVHDAGSVGGSVYYFIMEYVEGTDLSIILRDHGPLPVRDAVGYIRQAAAALGYAHKQNIIHRDIKPENLLLTRDSTIKVADLGLAKWVGEEASMLTQTGDVMGSPIYISPERLRDPLVLDKRTDIYSLGCTLFHLVTGRIPYEGTSPVIMAMHLTSPPPDPRDVNPVLDTEISRIIQKMMAKDLNERYQTMEEVDADLAKYLARPPSRIIEPDKTRKLPRAVLADRPSGAQEPGKSRLVPVAAAVVVVALAAGGAFFVLKKPSPAPAPATAHVASKPPESAPAPAAVEPKPAAPAVPPLVIADFAKPFRNNIGGEFGAWNSQRPDPPGKCSERVDTKRGPDGTPCWEVTYDISTPGAFGGSWMKLEGIDATPYDTMVFKAKTESGGTTDFIIELKVAIGGSRVMRRYTIREVGTQWKTIEIPLRSFGLPALKPLSELTIVFDKQTTTPKKGIVLFEDIQLIKK